MTASPAADAGTKGSGGLSGGVVALIVIAGLIVVAAGAWRVLRRRPSSGTGRSGEQDD